jgi:hypothetical protein
MKLIQVCCVAALLVAGGQLMAHADEGPTVTGPPNAAEKQFVQSVTQDLMNRFPRVSDAVRAGYVRYTGVDDSGAISYANQQWSSDPTHPSQLWYDRSGNLLGADFSALRPNGEPRPVLWNVDPGRWVELNGHIHYVTRQPDGSLKYDQWVWNQQWLAAGGSLAHPSAATLVRLGRVKSASDVTTIFEFPTIWDLTVWVVPHGSNPFSWD